jgi:hypothetical protein
MLYFYRLLWAVPLMSEGRLRNCTRSGARLLELGDMENMPAFLVWKATGAARSLARPESPGSGWASEGSALGPRAI